MNIHFSNGRECEEGFIYVATKHIMFYEMALLSAQTLRDYHKTANITLFTHEKFVDERAYKLFDKVITNIPIHHRAKMWGMARTPYQRTLYNDCDSFIRHGDIKKIISHLDDGTDMFFGTCLGYTVGSMKWLYIDKQRKIEPKYHGSLCGYTKTDLTIDFMQTWFDEYLKQITTPWAYEANHNKEWKQFDMFTLWRMTSGKFAEFDRFNKLNIKLLTRRWNNTVQDLPDDLDGRPVITQYDKTSWMKLPTVGEILKGIKDETRTLKIRPSADSTFDFN